MKLFLRDFFVYWIGESAIIALLLFYLAEPMVGPEFNHHGLLMVYFYIVGMLGLLSLSIALSTSERRHNEKRKQDYEAAVTQNRRNALISFAEERYNNTTSQSLHHLTIETYVPSKWRFIDLETNTTWKFDNGEFVEDTKS